MESELTKSHPSLQRAIDIAVERRRVPHARGARGLGGQVGAGQYGNQKGGERVLHGWLCLGIRRPEITGGGAIRSFVEGLEDERN